MGMTTADAIKHFGSQYAISKALGIAQPSVCKWGECPPDLRQLQIESLTGGSLKAEKYILPTSEKKYRNPAANIN